MLNFLRKLFETEPEFYKEMKKWSKKLLNLVEAEQFDQDAFAEVYLRERPSETLLTKSAVEYAIIHNRQMNYMERTMKNKFKQSPHFEQILTIINGEPNSGSDLDPEKDFNPPSFAEADEFDQIIFEVTVEDDEDNEKNVPEYMQMYTVKGTKIINIRSHSLEHHNSFVGKLDDSQFESFSRVDLKQYMAQNPEKGPTPPQAPEAPLKPPPCVIL